MRPLLICFVSFSALLGYDSVSASDNGSELFRGVLSSRVDLRGQGTIELRFTAGDTTNRATFEVDFDGDRRRLESRGEVNVFDGEKLMIYERGTSMNIRDTTSGGPSYCFDVRLLGLSATLLPYEHLEKTLSLAEDSAPLVARKERINDVECSVLSFRNEFGNQVELWVDDSRHFRVHKAVVVYETESGSLIDRITSEFNEDSVLPSLVTSERVSIPAAGDAEVTRFEREIRLTNLVHRRPAGTPFAMESLGMDPGIPVTDIRIRERIGYWDGEKLVESLREVSRPRR